MLRVWDLQVSIYGPEAGYPEVFRGFPQSLPEKESWFSILKQGITILLNFSGLSIHSTLC
jgi:hypothetical protein